MHRGARAPPLWVIATKIVVIALGLTPLVPYGTALSLRLQMSVDATSREELLHDHGASLLPFGRRLDIRPRERALLAEQRQERPPGAPTFDSLNLEEPLVARLSNMQIGNAKKPGQVNKLCRRLSSASAGSLRVSRAKAVDEGALKKASDESSGEVVSVRELHQLKEEIRQRGFDNDTLCSSTAALSGTSSLSSGSLIKMAAVRPPMLPLSSSLFAHDLQPTLDRGLYVHFETSSSPTPGEERTGNKFSFDIDEGLDPGREEVKQMRTPARFGRSELFGRSDTSSWWAGAQTNSLLTAVEETSASEHELPYGYVEHLREQSVGRSSTLGRVKPRRQQPARHIAEEVAIAALGGWG
ncbi:unnamed protein product [Amoebophrya sp. A120]|nr:unnamed protein product [Amoebophrya sp. A120]|eukprot:GSA120T00010814001.1